MSVTPKDIEEPGPQPEDSPWAGILGVYGPFSFSDNRRLVAIHATYYRTLGGPPTIGRATTTDWVNLSFELRF